MFLLENSRCCKELLIERYNKVGDLNLYVVNARFHLKCLFLALKFAFPLISQNGGVTHFVREKVINGDVLIKFISTNNQLVDIFTKGLSTARLQLLKSRLMVDSSSISLRGDFSDDNSAVITDPTLEPHDPTTHKRKVVSYNC